MTQMHRGVPLADDIELVFRLDPPCSTARSRTTRGCRNSGSLHEARMGQRRDHESGHRRAVEPPKSRYSKGRTVSTSCAHHGERSRTRVADLDHARSCPRISITVNLGYGREIGSERELRSWHIFDLDHKIDVYNEGPIANGVGRNVSVLRSAAMERVIPSVQVERAADHVTRSSRRRSTVRWKDARSCVAPRWRSIVSTRHSRRMPSLWSPVSRITSIPSCGASVIRRSTGLSRQSLLPESVGDVDRPERMHRLQRVYRGVCEREQHPGRRQAMKSGVVVRCTGFVSIATSSAGTARKTSPRCSSSRCSVSIARMRRASRSARSRRRSTRPTAPTR
jgi:hypothetical protein